MNDLALSVSMKDSFNHYSCRKLQQYMEDVILLTTVNRHCANQKLIVVDFDVPLRNINSCTILVEARMDEQTI
ncbi:hypothetical protein T265_08360 [Opisthorchis viverrini]|uniref:Uncharacterized protein n=1 Tax=Opisthorchis viverrini TaxID=6198 RepID=A0A075A8N8_OPIVI|nr:hypothetical protein T265_08360 [Opisthorchis viverrini]KER23859.1 hypothetical protein T265_08360 [Opisthorchis viverrini]